jgi:putative DNA primase/helicase
MGYTANDNHERLNPVSPAAPCEVCGGDHKCSRGDEGLILCGRCDGPEPGFVHLGPAEGDPEFHLYRAGRTRRPRKRPVDRTKAAQRPDGPTWLDRARAFAANITPAERAALAQALSLPAGVLAGFPLLGWDRDGAAWTAG